MKSPLWKKNFLLSIHSPGIGTALLLLAFTQVPIAVKNLAEVACIGQVSNELWKNNSHSQANKVAVQRCNGGNI